MRHAKPHSTTMRFHFSKSMHCFPELRDRRHATGRRPRR
jgi:hypothetical protein